MQRYFFQFQPSPEFFVFYKGKKQIFPNLREAYKKYVVFFYIGGGANFLQNFLHFFFLTLYRSRNMNKFISTITELQHWPASIHFTSLCSKEGLREGSKNFTKFFCLMAFFLSLSLPSLFQDYFEKILFGSLKSVRLTSRTFPEIFLWY